MTKGNEAGAFALRGSYSLRYAGAITAQERFTLIRRADGSQSLQAFIRMSAPPLDRQISLELDRAGRPRAAAVMLQKEDSFSSAWFSVRGSTVTSEIDCDRFGRVSQSIAMDAPVGMFGTHALVNDGWFTRLHDAGGPALQRFVIPVSSVSPKGDSGLLVDCASVSIERGEGGEVTTAAGTFRIERFAIGFGHLPPLDVAVRSEDRLLVRMDWAHDDAVITLDELGEI